MKWMLLTCLVWHWHFSVAQVSNEDLKTIMIVRDLERESRPSRAPDTGPVTEGDPYFTPYWCSGRITLYRENKSYDLSAMKFDVFNNGIDVLFDKSVLKSLDGGLVRAFEYKDSVTNLPRRFVNGRDYTRDGTAITGFLEVLCWGKVDVFALTTATLLKPNYNVTLGSGSPNYQIVKKRVLLYGPGTELRPLNKKELKLIWAEKEAEMTKFQKVNKLNPSRDRDLMLMIDYFNTL